MKYHYSLISMALLMAGCGGEDAVLETSLPEYVLSGSLSAQTSH